MLCIKIIGCFIFFGKILCDQESIKLLLPETENLALLGGVLKKVRAECTSLYKCYFYNNSTTGFAVAEVMQQLNIPYEIATKPLVNKVPVPMMNFDDDFIFVILTEDIENIYPVALEAYSAYQIVNRSKILALANYQPEKASIEGVFKKMWKSYMLNVVLVCLNHTTSPKMYTYNPYQGDFSINLPVHSEGLVFFPEKTRNLYGRNISIVTFKIVPSALKVFWKGSLIWVGTAIEEIPLLIKYCNGTGLIDLNENLTFGAEKFVNKTHSVVIGGAESDIEQGKKDITTQRGFLHPSLHFDYIQPTELGGKVILIPKASPIPYYLTFFSSSKRIVGYGVILTIFVVAVVIKLIFIIFDIKMSANDVLFKTFTSFMSQGGLSDDLPLPARIVVAAWGIFCMILISAISGELIQSFIILVYEKDIDDPAEALRVPHWNFYTFEGYMSVLAIQNVTMNALLKKRVKGLSKSLLYEKALNATGNDAFVVTKPVADYIIGRVGSHVYYKTNLMVQDLYSFYVKRGSPFYVTLKTFTSRLVSTGLFNFWARKISWYDRQYKILQPPDNSFTLKEFLKILLVLASGLGISTLIFIFELLGKNVMKTIFELKNQVILKMKPKN